jgi:hypothetical protein
MSNEKDQKSNNSEPHILESRHEVSTTSTSSDSVVIEINKNVLQSLVLAHDTPASISRNIPRTINVPKEMRMRRTDSLDDLIMAPSRDADQIYNLNALLLSHRNSVKIDSKCFELMYEKAVRLNKWISRLIHIIGFVTLILSAAGVVQVADMQPYIMGTVTFLFGMNGYKDHEHLESGVEALEQCVSFTNEIYTDVNYFLYRSNHSIEALNVFVSAIDDKLKIFDRTTRLPIPLNIKIKILGVVKLEKQEWANNHAHDNPTSVYKIRKKHKRHSVAS